MTFLNVRLWPRNSPHPHLEQIRGVVYAEGVLARWKNDLAEYRALEPEQDWRLETCGTLGVWTEVRDDDTSMGR